jgi:hypothetical protein
VLQPQYLALGAQVISVYVGAILRKEGCNDLAWFFMHIFGYLRPSRDRLGGATGNDFPFGPKPADEMKISHGYIVSFNTLQKSSDSEAIEVFTWDGRELLGINALKQLSGVAEVTFYDFAVRPNAQIGSGGLIRKADGSLILWRAGITRDFAPLFVDASR